MNNRISELRKKNNMTTSDLAKKLNITPRTIQRYEKNELTPTVEKLISLKEIFDCSIDYLLCLSDDNDNNLEVSKDTKDVFSKRLKDVIIGKELTKETLAKKLEVAKITIDKYLEGEEFPTLDELILITLKLNVTIDFLLNSDSKDVGNLKIVDESIEIKKSTETKKIPIEKLRDFLDSKSQE